MQTVNVKAKQAALHELRITDTDDLVLRLMKIEAELVDHFARSSDAGDPESGFAKFYSRVVATRQAAEAALHAEEAR